MNPSASQSAIDPAGLAAERIADLFWWMTGGAVLVWIAVLAFAIYVILVPQAHDTRASNLIIIGGGVVFPTVVLTVLLCTGLSMLPGLVAPAPEGSLKISVTGYQWWWRVTYRGDDGGAVELANEIVLPVGEPVEFRLASADVVHGFWIPSLGGKVDMIPGRETRLVLHPTRVGEFRGVCSEFCGYSHALMNFHISVVDRDEFDTWLERQQRPASEAADPRGKQVFLRHGCGACHRIRGSGADGVIGPDLTHFGSRKTLGASLLPNDAASLRRWIAETDQLKPGVHMPAYGMLSDEVMDALVEYLGGLQ